MVILGQRGKGLSRHEDCKIADKKVPNCKKSKFSFLKTFLYMASFVSCSNVAWADKDYVSCNGMICNDTIVENNESFWAGEKATVNNTTVKEGGEMVVQYATANDTKILSGGTIQNNGTTTVIDGLDIAEGGKFNFTTEGTVTNIVSHTKDGDVNLDAYIKDKEAHNWVITDGSSLSLSSANAYNTVVKSGGLIDFRYSYNSKVDGLVIEEGGRFNFDTSMQVKNATLETDTGDVHMSIDNGVAKDFIITDGSQLEVSWNTSAEDTIVKDGGKIIIEDGSVDKLVVEQGGLYDVNTKATINNTAIKTEDGNFDVSIHDGVAKDWVITDGSKMTISSGDSAENTHVKSGGTVDATYQGSLKNTTLDKGSHYFLSTNSSADNLLIKTDTGDVKASIKDKTAENMVITDGSKLDVQDGGMANNTIVQDGGLLYSQGTGTINNITFEKGGMFDLNSKSTVTDALIKTAYGDFLASIKNEVVDNWVVTDGSRLTMAQWGNGVANNILVLEGGKFYVNDGIVNGVTIEQGGSFGFNTDDIINNAVLKTENGDLNLEIKDKVANNWVITKDSSLYVNDDGTANNTIVQEGGLLGIGGGTANHVISSGDIDTMGGGTINYLTLNGGRAMADWDATLNHVNVNFGAQIMQQGAIMNDVVINEGGYVNIRHGTVNDVLVKGGAIFEAINPGACSGEMCPVKVNNLTALSGSQLYIGNDSILTGEILIDKAAKLGGGFDYSSLFSNATITDITLSGGVNEQISADNNDLISTGGDKTLGLSQGEYFISGSKIEGVSQVNGWKSIDIKNVDTSANASATVVKAMGDLTAENINISDNTELNVAGNSPLNLTLNGNITNDGNLNFNHAGDEADDTTTITGNYTAGSNAKMTIDVDPVNLVADKLIVNGDVVGNTKLLLEVSSTATLNGKILFAEVHNDNLNTDSSFDVWRVNGSALMWNSEFDNLAKEWYLSSNGSLAPEIDVEVAPEILAYAALAGASMEQTRSLSRVINSQVSNNEEQSIWVAPVYESATINSPVEFSADITGFDAGADFVHTDYGKIGAFVSYRSGKYDVEGKGENVYSDIGSDINITSYLAGLYHRYEENNFWIMSTAFGGVQQADISTKDGLNASSDALELGASFDIGYLIELENALSLEPTAGVHYTQISYDDIQDEAGKDINFGSFREIEVEAGVKLKKDYVINEGKVSGYIKPSVVHSFASGSDLQFAGLKDIEILKDRTYGRLEVGVSAQLFNNLDANVSVSQTFGGDYDSTAVNLGLVYHF